MKKQTALRIIFALFIFWGTAGAGLAADPLVVAFAKWPPWKIINQNQFDGIDARIVRALAKKAGFTIEFKECPWPRCVDMMKTGEADLITSLGKTTERKQFVYYLGDSYYQEHIAFWVRKEANFSIEHYDDLYGKAIGCIKGSVYFTRFDQDRFLRKVLVNMEDQMFRMLRDQRIDGFIGYEIPIEYALAVHGFSHQFKKTVFRAEGPGSYIAMSKKSNALKWQPRIIDVLRQMRDTGEIERIIDSFLFQVEKELKQSPAEH